MAVTQEQIDQAKAALDAADTAVEEARVAAGVAVETAKDAANAAWDKYWELKEEYNKA